MKRKRFTEEQIVAILKEAAGTDNAREVVRKHGITETTFYRWKAKYGGMGLPEVKRLKSLEEENARLKRLVAAPEHHRLLLENARVRVLDTPIAPGQRTPVHTHQWPAVHYVVRWGAFVRRAADETVLVDSRSVRPSSAPPSVLWGEPLAPHSLENVDSTLIHIVSVELEAPSDHPHG